MRTQSQPGGDKFLFDSNGIKDGMDSNLITSKDSEQKLEFMTANQSQNMEQVPINFTVDPNNPGVDTRSSSIRRITEIENDIM